MPQPDFYWTGVGSRDTPLELRSLMEITGTRMTQLGGRGRSGGARGPDEWFESGARSAETAATRFDVYLPFEGFKGRYSSRMSSVWDSTHFPTYTTAQYIASTLHPNWKACLNGGAYQYHTRNVFEVVGKRLTRPSRIVIGYARTVRGVAQGGTGLAIRLAEKLDIPVLNLYNPQHLNLLQEFVDTDLPSGVSATELVDRYLIRPLSQLK